MIINERKAAEVLQSEVNQTVNMTIDDKDKSVLMMILSEGLYSDPIGSMIRELTTNALDSHIEAKNSEPIIVGLTKNSEGAFEFSVTDFGIGLSPERVENVFSKYASSTKRGSSEQYGFFGLGSKSPLAYTDSFIIISTYEGTKYTYNMYKGEDGTMLSLLLQEDTEDKNGVKIIVPLRTNDDYYNFKGKIQDQLCYFENVYFDIDNIYHGKDTTFSNDFKIIKHEDWKFSEMYDGNRKMHLCLDNVRYDIDWSKLGIDSIYLPVGISFKVTDGITPTPNRENIIITPTVKKMILEKIERVELYFASKYNASRSNIFEVWEMLSNNYEPCTTIEGIMFDLSDLKDILDKPNIAGIEKLNLERVYDRKHNLLDSYADKSEIKNNKYITDSSFRINLKIDYIINKQVKVILTDGQPLSKVKIDYIKDTIGDCYFITKSHKNRKLLKSSNDFDSYATLLNLKKDNKENWRQIITEYQRIESMIADSFIKVEDLEPTEEWLAERKANRKRAIVTKVDKEEINPKIAEESSKSDIICKFVSEGPQVIDTLNQGIYIYDLYDNRPQLERLFKIINTDKTIKIAILVNRDIERIKQSSLTNWFSFEEYMKGEHISFGKFCTAHIIKEYLQKTPVINYLYSIEKIDSELADNIHKAKKYYKELLRYSSLDSYVMQDMLAICTEKNCWDMEYYNLFNDIKDAVPYIEFITCLEVEHRHRIDKELTDRALELAKTLYEANKNNTFSLLKEKEEKNEQVELEDESC